MTKVKKDKEAFEDIFVSIFTNSVHRMTASRRPVRETIIHSRLKIQNLI